MPRDDVAYLLDMLLAAHDAVHFATGLTSEQFEQSRLHQKAILKAIEIIGEAAGRIMHRNKTCPSGHSMDSHHRYAQPPRACLL
jgi:uncharacterized protein with HEPN domain